MLRTAEKTEAADRDQDADLSRLRGIIAAAGEKIARLDPNLKAEALRERTAAIRNETFPPARPLREAIAKRAAAARAAERHWTPEAIRRAALLALAPSSRTALHITLYRATTGELVEYLHDAFDKGSLAETEAVRLEFSRREDREPFGGPSGRRHHHAGAGPSSPPALVPLLAVGPKPTQAQAASLLVELAAGKGRPLCPRESSSRACSVSSCGRELYTVAAQSQFAARPCEAVGLWPPDGQIPQGWPLKSQPTIARLHPHPEWSAALL